MRLAFCLYRYFPYSGLSRDFMRILHEAQSRGHDIKVYAYKWQGERPTNADIQLLPARAFTNHGRNTHFYRLLLKALDGEYFDAIVGFNKMPGLNLYYGADYCYVARAKPKYSPLYRLTPRFAQQTRFERAVFDVDGNTTILSLSPREKGVYQQHYGTPEHRFVMMPPTLDIARKPEGDLNAKRQKKRQKLGLSAQQKLILFIGSGFRTKGLDRAIHAVAALPKTLLETSQLYVIGQDDIRPYQHLVKRLNLTGKVHFLGGRSDVPELMLAGDVLLHPAISENTGTVILEAIASGLPVIATDVCGYAPHIELAQTGQVLRSPFSQPTLNLQLQKTLTAPNLSICQENGRRYGQDPALYQMPQTAVDAIEQWGEQHELADTVTTKNALQNRLPPALHGFFPQAETAADLVKTIGILVTENADYRIVEICHQGKRLHLKTFSSTAWHTLIYYLLRGDLPEAGAQQEWHAAHHLHRLGIRTAKPLAWGSMTSQITNRYGYLIREPLPENQSLADYLTTAQPPTNLYFSLIRQTAQIVSNIHQSGARHGALSLEVFRVIGTPINPEQISLALAGLARFKINGKRTCADSYRDLAMLYAASRKLPRRYQPTQRDYFRFIKHYHDSPLRLALQNHTEFWRAVLQQAEKYDFKQTAATYSGLFDLSDNSSNQITETPLRATADQHHTTAV